MEKMENTAMNVDPTIPTLLSGGSGAKIELFHQYGIVRKSVETRNRSDFDHLYSQYIWMKAHSHFLPNMIPKIYDCGFTDEGTFFYNMEYLSQVKLDRDTWSGDELAETIKSVMAAKFPYNKSADFKTYINRLYSHLWFLKSKKIFNDITKVPEFEVSINGKEEVVKNISLFDYFNLLETNKSVYNMMVSNCHGDFTLGNMIGKAVVDSNHLMGDWNSWILDVSKLWQSLHYHYEDVFNPECNTWFDNESRMNWKIKIDYVRQDWKHHLLCDIKSRFEGSHKDILVFELSHYLRMLKYKLAISEDDFVKAYVIMCIIWQQIKDIK